MKGVVICPQLRAAEKGFKILVKGGNAVDMAIATVFVQTTVAPTMCSVGGFGTIPIYMAKTRETDSQSRFAHKNKEQPRVTANMAAPTMVKLM